MQMQKIMKQLDSAQDYLKSDMRDISLNDKILILWMLRRLWNRQPLEGDENLTVIQAINLCRSLLQYARPNSLLEKHTTEYLNDLIAHGCKSHMERAQRKAKAVK